MMNHIYDQPQFGENWFTYPNLYSRFVKELEDESKIVEVGCWKGKSIAYLAVEVANSGKSIKIDGIDMWTAGLYGGETNDGVVYAIFNSNIASLRHLINPIKMKSVDGSKLYKDESIDVVFIDAFHSYECVKEDIACWLPKVKKGGYLAGHDWSHEGVKKAVEECLTDLEITEDCWVYKKP